MKVLVRVTREHIDQSIGNPTGKCPVERAVTDAMPDIQLVSALPHVILLRYTGGMDYFIQTSKSVTRFINTFDWHKEIAVGPFSFYLNFNRTLP